MGLISELCCEKYDIGVYEELFGALRIIGGKLRKQICFGCTDAVIVELVLYIVHQTPATRQ